MATKKPSTSKLQALPLPDEPPDPEGDFLEDDGDELPKPAAKKVARKRVHKVAQSKKPPVDRRTARQRQAQSEFSAIQPGDDDEDEQDESDGEALPNSPPRQFGRYSDRQRAELHAALQLKAQGLPVFPYPPELPASQQPYWLELVNSRPHDYFNKGDIPLLKMYVRTAADLDRLDREIEEYGDVIMNARGNPVVNPKVTVRAIAAAHMLSLATKLRAQPTARIDSANDKARSEKVKNAEAAASTLAADSSDGDDDDGLLAGSMRLPAPRSVN